MSEPADTPTVLRPTALRFFEYGHLPPSLQPIGKKFSRLADRLVQHLPASDERTVALRKLLEAKDCAVRAAL
jgi:hypothetical protein